MRGSQLLLKIILPVIVMLGVVVIFLVIAERTESPAVKRPPETSGKIDGNLLVRPTMVKLDFQDRPMSEVLQVLSARTGCPLRTYELRKDWLATTITIHEPDPLPFWQAVDRLCAVGHFQCNLSLGSIFFFRDEIPGPISDRGAFRVQLQEIAYNGRFRYLHLRGDHSSLPISQEQGQENFVIKLHIMVEPRIMIRNNGDMKKLSVIDDLGQSLLGLNPEGEQPPFDFGYTTGGYVIGQVPLKRIDRPGTVIRELRGVAPVAVAARRPDPLVIPLAGAAGRSVDSGESVVTIRRVMKITPHPKGTFDTFDPVKKELKPQPVISEATGIELTVRPSDRRQTPIHGADSRKPEVSQLDLPSLSEHQFEVVDADGQVWTPSPWWFSNDGPQQQGRETHVLLSPVDGNLSPWPWQADLTGAKLLFYDKAEVKVDVPFKFADITLP